VALSDTTAISRLSPEQVDCITQFSRTLVKLARNRNLHLTLHQFELRQRTLRLTSSSHSSRKAISELFEASSADRLLENSWINPDPFNLPHRFSETGISEQNGSLCPGVHH
jgi:hypothetical protein